jgi:hypothetical protein
MSPRRSQRTSARPQSKRLDPPRELHPARDALDAARELAPRQLSERLDGQRIRHAHDAGRGGERRLENGRGIEVAPAHLEGLTRGQREGAAAERSRIAANTLGPSKAEAHSQSIAPSRAMSAATRPSPMTA